MTIAVLQTLAAIGAGYVLFRLWRAARPPQLWLRLVVAAGFLTRAIAGQLLFWISWARLPFLTALQAGNGLWFFGVDALGYFANASAASSQGVAAIAGMSPSQPAVVYAQLLALATLLLGAVTSTGLLINLFCYLGCIALLRRWTNAAVAITAISLSPSFVLWSLQPLKDTFFQLLVVAFVFACAAWQNLWIGPPRWRSVAARGALLVLLLAALSGVRWYVAFALLIAATPFLLATALRTRERKGIALVAAAGVALLLSRALLAGGRGHVPQPIVALLTPATTLATMSDLPALLGSEIAAARDAFNESGGRTVIQPSSRSTPPPEPPSTTAGDAQIRDVVARIIDGWNRGDAEAILANFDDTPEVELWNDGKRVAGGPDEVRDVYGALAASSEGERVAIDNVRVTIDGATATASGQWRRESRRHRVDGSVTFVLRHRGERWRVVRQTIGDSGHPQVTASSAPHAPRHGLLAQLATGLAAIFLPRVIGEALGLFHIGGGRGFLWLTDVDTILFDIALLVSIAVIARRFRAASRDPLVWMLIAFTLLIALPLAYAVTNFGTLFRLRETVYLGIILAPAAAIAAAARRAPGDR
ncbi:MAG TPA: nuclear transport factor 2 family protein [Thermoanaerobaculia bacterium]|nr:nuclear transport factor 2 family protein [Thermoanaerobaculia bacterium]